MSNINTSRDMKKIKNKSGQGLEVFLKTEIGPKPHWLAPKQVIQVPQNYISDQAELLQKRKLIKIY